MKFTALFHHVTVDLLRDSFGSLKRKAAPGVDGVTWQEYEAALEDRLACVNEIWPQSAGEYWLHRGKG